MIVYSRLRINSEDNPQLGLVQNTASKTYAFWIKQRPTLGGT